jgi:hypothetical protein
MPRKRLGWGPSVLALVVVATVVWARLPVTVARSGAGGTGS